MFSRGLGVPRQRLARVARALRDLRREARGGAHGARGGVRARVRAVCCVTPLGWGGVLRQKGPYS